MIEQGHPGCSGVADHHDDIGLLVEASWHWVFLVNVPVGIVALVAGLRVLTETGTGRTGMPDLLGAFVGGLDGFADNEIKDVHSR